MLGRSCLALAVLCVLACTGNGRGPLSAVRDSAGISIVESQGARWAQELPTRVADELLVQVGAAHGSESEELFRVGQIRWLDDNQFILVNSRTELRVYNLHGELIRQLGREGEGPGEYRRISGISVLRNGNLVVADTQLRRITFLDPLGQVLRTTEAQGPVPVSTDLVGDQWLVGRLAGTGRGDGPRVNRLVDSIVAVNTESGGRSIWATTPGVRVDWRRFPNGVIGPYNFAIAPVSCVAGRGIGWCSDRPTFTNSGNKGAKGSWFGSYVFRWQLVRYQSKTGSQLSTDGKKWEPRLMPNLCFRTPYLTSGLSSWTMS